jgi:hypothetical protein
MARLPELRPAPIVEAIWQARERASGAWRPGARLGASQIGQDCDRALWYSFRWCSRARHDGRTLRLFETGALEEARMAADLRAIGCEVHTHEAGRQFEFTACNGHFVCRIDGACRGLPESSRWHLLEFKTSNAKGFRLVSSKGCEHAKPEHYAQCQAGMALAKLDRALYLVKNKDDEDLYAERIHHDRAASDALLARAAAIIASPRPLARCDSHACQWCSHRALCGGGAAEVTCRTCLHADPVDGGAWACAATSAMLDYSKQMAACPSHVYIPDLVPFEQTNATDECVEYQTDDGLMLNGPGGVNSHDLRGIINAHRAS